MSNDEAKQRAKNYMSLKGALEPKQIKCYCGHTIMCDCSPLEEPKDVVLGYKTSLDAQMLDRIEPKQESLEEAAEIYASHSLKEKRQKDLNMGFKDGAKWQQERMYSEEEVRDLFKKYQYDLAQWVLRMEDDIDGKPIPTEWFEQFKKK
jgi:hypothetical protein